LSEFVADLESPRWWFSVVVAGIVVNIGASYLMRLLDGRLAAASIWWRRRRETDQRTHLAQLGLLRGNEQQQRRLAATETRARFRSLVCLVQAVGVALTVIIFLTVGVPAWISGYTVVLFAALWYLYLYYARAADRAARLLADLANDLSA
jgi:Flp pilus assembly protein TadB